MEKFITNQLIKQLFFVSKPFPNLINSPKQKEIQKENQKEEINFQDLPDEIVLDIFSYLEPNNLIICSETCKQFNRIHNDWFLWKNIVRKYPLFLDFEKVTKKYDRSNLYNSFQEEYFFTGSLGIEYYFKNQKEDQISSKLVNLINKNGKTFVVDQMKKIIQARKSYEKKIKTEERKRKIHEFNEYKMSKLIKWSIVPFLLIFPIILIALKFDFQNSFLNWKMVLFPWLYSFFIFFFWWILHFYSYPNSDSEKLLLMGIGIGSGFMTIFFLLLALRLDHNLFIPNSVILTFFAISGSSLIIFWIIFLIQRFKASDLGKSDIVLVTNFLAYVMISFPFVFISIKTAFNHFDSKNSDSSWISTFIPLFILSLYPILALILIVLFRLNNLDRSDYMISGVSALVGFFLGLISLLSFLKIEKIINLSATIISSPIFIASLFLEWIFLNEYH
ncbi:f-box only protein [Anaeramoeba ignava]|uniref:F-box only protein n=1 Tax=Anaeramoeba ignava TaxID=1746090 RepID=A0A9Q0RFY2_ANAIG|nr:f-box only protein [Anaeramoeba ignava]